jgi:hypothetical protein
VTDVTLADSYPNTEAAAQSLHDALMTTLHADGEPRLLRRDDMDDLSSGVLFVWTNVPDDSVVEQYFFLDLVAEGGGVRVVSLLTAALGRDGLLCGGDLGSGAFGNGPDTVPAEIVCP